MLSKNLERKRLDNKSARVSLEKVFIKVANCLKEAFKLANDMGRTC